MRISNVGMFHQTLHPQRHPRRSQIGHPQLIPHRMMRLFNPMVTVYESRVYITHYSSGSPNAVLTPARRSIEQNSSFSSCFLNGTLNKSYITLYNSIVVCLHYIVPERAQIWTFQIWTRSALWFLLRSDEALGPTLTYSHPSASTGLWDESVVWKTTEARSAAQPTTHQAGARILGLLQLTLLPKDPWGLWRWGETAERREMQS